MSRSASRHSRFPIPSASSDFALGWQAGTSPSSPWLLARPSITPRAKGWSMSQVEIHGYAIVSDNDCIADASGQTPDMLRNEADWAYFQAELNRSTVTVLGRL